MSMENGDQPGIHDETVTPGIDRAKQPDAASEPNPGAGSARGEEGTADTETDELLRQRLQELVDENAELKDQLLRKSADFENFRKRMFRERDDAIKFANSALLRDLITTIDDFERAIKSSEESRDFDKLHEGIELIERQFTSMLERKYGLKRFESVGEVFDPEKHEAISVGETHPSSDVPIVLEDYQKGFMLHDRIIRAAKVKVSLEAQAANAKQNKSDDDSNSDGIGIQGE
ncbi:MAG TPA: nucleotide exchange factor GrpE [Spirochaetia bacterium]|nr:nucleotide exchange factor GrpE [Spirochaetia bacterium]